MGSHQAAFETVVDHFDKLVGVEVLIHPDYKLGSVSPSRVDRVGESHLFRITAIPGVLGKADLLNRSLVSEWWQW